VLNEGRLLRRASERNNQVVARSLPFRGFIAVLSGLLWGLPSGTFPAFSQESSFSPGNPGEAPRITVAETKFEFGEVDEGSEISHDFIVMNRGKGELRITKVSRD